MSLKIGDVSKLLSMSPETIRYYESEKIISPTRNKDSKYRRYEPWDIFHLMDCKRNRSLGLSIKDLTYLATGGGSVDYIALKVKEQEQKIQKELQYNFLLQTKLNQIRTLIETIAINQGNYWYSKTQEQLCYVCFNSDFDQYDDLDDVGPLFSKWLEYLPFVDFSISLERVGSLDNIRCDWLYTIEKEYAEILRIPIDDTVTVIPSHLSLNTVIDIGEKGNFSLDQLDAINRYIDKSEYKICAKIIGKLIARINDGDGFHRYLYMEIPVSAKK